ncbi:hypothetical protein ABRZ04_05255 [Castellaniella ginsengisoli]|uniref:XRE family transcriptional regulator n=1 Tax=Castellaniella ginsengisoli TaxID=546114 RepID=A0AB39CSB7_9BURK
MIKPIRPAPAIDWNAIFLTLRREGYTVRDVADIVGIPTSTIKGWMAGSEPRHQDGETIIQFWCEAADRPRESVPTIEGFTSHLAARRRN